MKKIRHSLALMALFTFQLFQTALADVPTPEATSGGTAVTDGFWAWLTGWFQDIVLYGVPAVLAAGLLWCLWELLSKVMEQRKSREPEWGGVLAFSAFTAGYFVVALGISAVILNMFA